MKLFRFKIEHMELFRINDNHKPVSFNKEYNYGGSDGRLELNLYHTLTSALMVLCGERPINAKHLTEEMDWSLYNKTLYDDLLSVVGGSEFSLKGEGHSVRRLLRDIRNKTQIKTPRILPEPPKDLAEALDKLVPGMNFYEGLEHIATILHKKENHYRDQIKNQGYVEGSKYHKFYQFLTETKVEPVLVQYFDFFFDKCKFTPGYIDSRYIRKYVLLSRKLIKEEDLWAWQTTRHIDIYDGILTFTVDDHFAKVLFDRVKLGPRVAGFCNNGMIIEDLPPYFSELENVL